MFLHGWFVSVQEHGLIQFFAQSPPLDILSSVPDAGIV
jgi:hypothetical protein